MISFKISFVLTFKIKPKVEPKARASQKNLQKGKKKVGSSNNLKSRVKSEAIETLEVAVVHPKHVFEVDELVGVAHIEYELIPHKLKYAIDVKCWDPVAKIFTNDGIITLKTVRRGNMVWVPICLEHFVQHLRLEEVKDLRNYVVKFDVVTNENKLGKAATLDKSKIFYTHIKEAEATNFVEAYDQDPNLLVNIKNLEEVMDTMVTKSIHYSDHDCATKVQLLNDNYEQIYEIINKDTAGIEVECRDFVLPCSAAQEQAKKVKIGLDDKQSKIETPVKPTKEIKPNAPNKKNAPKVTVSENLTVEVPAEVFFTDKNWVVYKEKNDNCVVRNMYVLVCVEHLLSRTQKLALDPLVIKIKKLSNVPVDILQEKGFTSIYASYCFPYVAECTTIQKPLERRIRFEEAHIFFNDNVSKLKLIEFLQTKRLLVEIHGIRKLPPRDQNIQLFGNEIDDKSISTITRTRKRSERIKTDSNDSSVLIAVAAFDLSSVVQNVWEFKEKGQCHVPGLTLHQPCQGFYDILDYSNVSNVNEINLNTNFVKTKHPVSEDVLLKFVTTLKVEVYLMAPQTASLILLRIPNTFKRFLFSIPSLELAKNILTSIFKHNEAVLTATTATSDRDLEILDVITGFMIDNNNSYTFFIEGLSTGFILSIENVAIVNFEFENSKFFFNTDTVFERRLYTTFLRDGLDVVTLRIPFYNILKDYRIYLEGNVPTLCLEALKKLYLLFHTALFKNIMQFNLLPRPEELLSLNLEWGVPMMVKQYDSTKQ